MEQDSNLFVPGIGFVREGQAREVEVPVQRETFEAQVLVVTKPYKKMQYFPYAMEMQYPLREIYRVLQSKKFSVELVPSSIANGKPTLIISEEESV